MHLASHFAARPPIEYQLTMLFEVCRKFMAMHGKPGTEQIDFTELLNLFKDIEDYLLSHLPKIPCECIEATKCDLCQGKEWLTIADLQRINAMLPLKPAAKLYVDRRTQEQKERYRARMRAWWRKNGEDWRASRSVSKPMDRVRKNSRRRALAASSKSQEDSKEANGFSVMENIEPTSGLKQSQ